MRMAHAPLPAQVRGGVWAVQLPSAAVVAATSAELVALGLLVVLPAAFDPAGVVTFEPLKTSLLRVGAALIGAAWLAYRFLGRPNIDVAAQPIVRTGLLVVGLAAISTLASIQPWLSFLGGFDRGMGWLTLAAGGVLFVVGSDLWTDERRRERVVSALLLGALAPCAYALLQRLGRDPISWTALGAPGSSLGSPTFLGGYLVLVVPFGLYRVLSRARGVLAGDTRATLAYAGWLAALLAIGAVLAQTTIRGPLLGLLGGTLTFALLLGRPGRLTLLGVGGFALVTLLLAASATGGAGVEGLGRFLRIAGAGDSSVERLVVWRDAIGLPLADPLRVALGFGPETQFAAFERAEATVRLTQNQQWDRAHNIILDTWLTGGLLGVVSLVLLGAVTGLSLARVWRTSDRHGALLAAAVLGSLVGHLVEVSFAFQTVVSGTLAWVVVGLAASLSARPVASGRMARRPWLAAVSVVVGVALVPALAAPAIADHMYGTGRAALQAGDARSAAAWDEAASRWAPWVEEPIRAAALAWQRVATQRADPAAARRAEAGLIEAARRSPWEPTPRVRLMRLYMARADGGESPASALDAAEAACQAAIAVGPYRATVWDACADVSGRRGLTEQARERHARGVALRN